MPSSVEHTNGSISGVRQASHGSSYSEQSLASVINAALQNQRYFQQQRDKNNRHTDQDDKMSAMSSNSSTNSAGHASSRNLYVHDVEHLATFTINSKQGVLKPEDALRKLRIMEKSRTIFPLQCQLIVDATNLVIMDKVYGEEVETFPLRLVHEPVGVISDNKNETFNNLLIFAVLDEAAKAKGNILAVEMHLFQCMNSQAPKIVDEMIKAKTALDPNYHQRMSQQQLIQKYQQAYKQQESGADDDDRASYRAPIRPSLSPAGSAAMTLASTTAAMSTQMSSLVRRGEQQPAVKNTPQQKQSKLELEVRVLNQCFDDIERFVTRLQNSAEFYKELERRQKQRKHAHAKSLGDGMLNMRAQMPPPQHYVDIYQKIKLAFNLLAHLKAYIHDPNAPELVHFLFTPLQLITGTAREPPYRGLAKSIWTPMLSDEGKELLLNCLTSREQDLWQSLGDAWTLSVSEARLQPKLYVHLDATLSYTPIFYNGWSPADFSPLFDAPLERNGSANATDSEIERLAFATAAGIRNQGCFEPMTTTSGNNRATQPPLLANKQQQQQQQQQQQHQRYYLNTQPVVGSYEQSLSSSPQSSRKNENVSSNYKVAATSTFDHHALNNRQSQKHDLIQHSSAFHPNASVIEPIAKSSQRETMSEMKKWAADLCYRGAKVYQVTSDRQANNDKELTVKNGELVEVLDDKRNWWRVRSFHGEIGHVPITILRQFELESLANTSNTFYNEQQYSYYAPLKQPQQADSDAELSPLYSHPAQHKTSKSTQLNHHSNSQLNQIILMHNSTALSTPPSSQATLSSSSSASNSAFNNNVTSSSNESVDNGVRMSDKKLLSKNINRIDEQNNESSLSESFIERSHNINSNTRKISPPPAPPLVLATSHQPAVTSKKPAATTPRLTTATASSVNSGIALLSEKSSVPALVASARKSEREPSLTDLQPVRDQLHEELLKRMLKTSAHGQAKRTPQQQQQQAATSITDKSSTTDVHNFLVAKEFSQKVVLILAELNGEELFTLKKADFERFCGKEEAARLESQINVQKSLCNYKERTDELATILRRRKEKSEVALS